jgi:hypothetical protein
MMASNSAVFHLRAIILILAQNIWRERWYPSIAPRPIDFLRKKKISTPAVGILADPH